jgi:hypothetical protein
MRSSIGALALTLALGGLLVAGLAACTNKLGGDLSVDGEKLELDSCRNGAVYGFRGVEVTGTSGVRVRVAATQTGEAYVVVMPKGASVGAELGACGSFQIADQKSTVNDVKNVQGTASLDCTARGVAVVGRFTFENCH